jgi:hypothetical protein
MKASLSMAFNDLRGKAGTVVVSKGRSGLVIKPKTVAKNPQTPAQQVARENLSRAAQAFAKLNASQIQQWKFYAEQHPKTNKVNGESYAPTALNVYTALATKILQVNPSMILPSVPPATDFNGDTIKISIGESHAGALTLESTGPNGSGVITEILVQRLASPGRTPYAKNFRTNQFYNWNPTQTLDIELLPGYYAIAYRFVKINTGQTSNLQIIPGVQTIGLSLTSLEEPEAEAA